ncbi:MAG: TonB-dependent receptor [Bacteroidales bacterium]|nr:TonB-dependent receptor [Bacteroidales bacterium]
MNQQTQYRETKWNMRLCAVLVCLLMSITASFAQISVRGVVSDAVGPVLGASVLEKGTGNGTVTDNDGNFSIKVKSADAVLVFSFVGYQTKEVAVKGQTNLQVTLEDSEVLDEVVVVGYGTMRKKDLTGSVVQINPEKIADSNPTTVQDVLRGTAGLQIGYTADAKGGGSMLLRGQNSLFNEGSHNSPLIILDGMIFNGELSEINPDDIGQIDVLKDASSAAIYGAKAASGVIIITTKKGKVGKPIINVSANLAANKKAEFRDVYGPDGYMKFREDWYKASTYGVRADGSWGYYSVASGLPEGYYSLEGAGGDKAEYARRLKLGGGNSDRVLDNYLAGKTYDWYDETFRTGFNQDYNASISGATENVSYYLSAGYMSNEGAVCGNDYSTTRVNMKLSGKVTNWLEIGANVNFQNRTDGDIQVALGSNYWDNNMLRNSPFAPIRDEDGKYIQYPMNYTPTNGGYNYGFERQYLDLDKGYTVLNAIFNARLTLPFGFSYNFNVAPRMQWFHDYYFISAEKPNANPSDCGANRNSSHNYDWSLNNTLTWDKIFDQHHFTLTLVQEAEEKKQWGTNLSARNITPTDALGYHYINGANKEQSSFSSDDIHSTSASYLGRLFYSFNDRYMVTTSFRRDGSSVFGQNNPWANFWSIGTSWVFSDENFCENLDWLSMGKLRLSYGTNGNSSLGDPYRALSLLSSGGVMVYPSGNSTDVVQALDMTRLGNPNLEWEKTAAYNVGLDFGFFDSILTGSIEWYYKKTEDMIMTKRLPTFVGFSGILTNLGQVDNSGIELTLNTRNISTHNFEWTTSFGFSYNKNEIKHIYYDYDENGKEMNDLSNQWYIGKTIGEIWTWEVDGIWQVNEVEEAAKCGQKPGDPKVVNHCTDDDVDGKPVYNDNDKVYLGATRPPVYCNMRNDFRYKDWTASISMYSYAGHKSIETYFLNNDNSGSMITNGCNTYKKKYWTPENPSNEYARLDAKSPNGATAYRLHNRSFLRLDNVNIGYTVPRKLTRKAAIDRLHVTVGINNLFTIDSYEYGDPETGGLSTRTFNFGLNFTL